MKTKANETIALLEKVVSKIGLEKVQSIIKEVYSLKFDGTNLNEYLLDFENHYELISDEFHCSSRYSFTMEDIAEFTSLVQLPDIMIQMKYGKNVNDIVFESSYEKSFSFPSELDSVDQCNSCLLLNAA